MKKENDSRFFVVGFSLLSVVEVICLIVIVTTVISIAHGQQLGWTQHPNTKLHAVCPWNNWGGINYPFNDNCRAAVSKWSGAAVDTKRDRLIVWGGGHRDYAGNEAYAVEPDYVTRLTNPSPVWDLSQPGMGPEALSDGNPNSRHTYEGLAYVAHLNKMAAFGGTPFGQSGGFTGGRWSLDLLNLIWTRLDSSDGPIGHDSGIIAEYDPVSKLVYVLDLNILWGCDSDRNICTKIRTLPGQRDNHLDGIIDPVRRLFLAVGNGYWIEADISQSVPNFQSLAPAGCDALRNAAYPGLAYDPIQKLIIGWIGGPSVIEYNPATQSCTTIPFPGGPGAPQANGTFGRFRYLPGKNEFILLNDADEDVWTLRLTSAFDVRCASPGVFLCFSFDDNTATQALMKPPQGETALRGSVVQDIPGTEGVGALKFIVPAQSGADTSGSWREKLPVETGPGQDLYFQYRVQYDSGMFQQFNLSEGWKTVIVGGDNTPGHTDDSCTQIDVVMQNESLEEFPFVYRTCGVYQSQQVPCRDASGTIVDFDDQPREDGVCSCPHYGNRGFDRSHCFYYQPNTWITFQEHIRVGQWGTPSTLVEIWGQYPSMASQLIFRKSDVTIPNDHPDLNAFDKLWLDPYQTHKDPNQVAAPTWVAYDSLIVSRQRIPDVQ